MIGENVEFNTKKQKWQNHPNGTGEYMPVKSFGKVMDKISDIHTHVAKGWAMGGNNVAVSDTVTYYMIADNDGKIHRVTPHNILRIVADGCSPKENTK